MVAIGGALLGGLLGGKRGFDAAADLFGSSLEGSKAPCFVCRGMGRVPD